MLAQSSDPQCAVKAVAPAPRVAIRYRPITELKLDPANPRIHSKKQIRQIAASITAFGRLHICERGISPISAGASDNR